MKTLNILLTSALLASIAFTGSVQADNSLSSLIYEESSNIYSEVTLKQSTPVGIISYSDDFADKSVWSSEYEQYVDPNDFNQGKIASIDSVNQYLSKNPTASGKASGQGIFIYNETAGEYHLQ